MAPVPTQPRVASAPLSKIYSFHATLLSSIATAAFAAFAAALTVSCGRRRIPLPFIHGRFGAYSQL
jgi:hypothetical protein